MLVVFFLGIAVGFICALPVCVTLLAYEVLSKPKGKTPQLKEFERIIKESTK